MQKLPNLHLITIWPLRCIIEKIWGAISPAPATHLLQHNLAKSLFTTAPTMTTSLFASKKNLAAARFLQNEAVKLPLYRFFPPLQPHWTWLKVVNCKHYNVRGMSRHKIIRILMSPDLPQPTSSCQIHLHLPGKTAIFSCRLKIRVTESYSRSRFRKSFYNWPVVISGPRSCHFINIKFWRKSRTPNNLLIGHPAFCHAGYRLFLMYPYLLAST